MNKSEYIKFSQYVGLDNDPCLIPDPAPIMSESDFDRILNEIFSVDPVSGLPMSDIQYYLSPNGNPQVREWLMNNLLKPRSASSGRSLDGVTDDMIHEFSRGVDESLDDYASRLNNIRDEAQKFMDSLKEEK